MSLIAQPCNAPGCDVDAVAGTMTDLKAGQHLDALDSTDQYSGEAGPGQGIGCVCGGSGLLGGGPEPGSVEASGSPADLTAPVG